MLHQATATGAGMGAGWFDAIGRGLQDFDVGQRVLDQITLDLFAGQTAGGVDWPGVGHGDAVAVMAQPFNGQLHASSSSIPMNPPDWRFQ